MLTLLCSSLNLNEIILFISKQKLINTSGSEHKYCIIIVSMRSFLIAYYHNTNLNYFDLRIIELGHIKEIQLLIESSMSHCSTINS